MNHIFISHSHEDSDFAEILHNKLEQAGFSVWRDTGIRGGEDWRKEIDEAIKGAFAIIVMITPESKSSEYVTYEWAFAWGAGVKVIPILLKRTELHPRLESLQHLDFTNRNVRPWDALVEQLGEAARLESRTEQPPQIEKVKIENRLLTMSGAERQRIDVEIADEIRKAKEHIDIHDSLLSKEINHPWQQAMKDALGTSDKRISVDLILADPKSTIYKKRHSLISDRVPSEEWPKQLAILAQQFSGQFRLRSTD